MAGPTADITLLKQAHLLARLSEGVGGIGDLAYVGIAELHPKGLGATPRRKPRGKDRPPEDVCFNRAFAKRRITLVLQRGNRSLDPQHQTLRHMFST